MRKERLMRTSGAWTRSTQAIVALVWLLGAFAAPTPGRAGAPEAVVLGLIFDRGRPVVSMTLNGEGPFRFFVDTGAGGNVLSAALAGRLGLDSVGVQRVFNPTEGSAVEVDIVEVAVVETGPLRLEDVRFMAADMPQLGDNHGVLGIRGLPPGLVTFDFVSGTVRIEPGVLDRDGGGVMPCELVPVVSVTGEVAGRPLVFHVDTGSPDGITLPGGLAAELPFEGELVPVRERGPLVVKSGRLLGTVRIGDLVLDNPEVQVVDLFRDFGNIGCGFLQDRVLTIDRSRGLLRMSPRPEDPPGTHD